jgi:two-component sensor histidine kinase/sensor domain CHASE-containing protein
LNLRIKALAIIGATMATLWLALGIILAVLNVQGFSRLEREDMERQVSRAEWSLRAELSRIGSIAGDWAPWDEAYRFIRGENPGFVADNLSEAGMANLRISLIAFIDLEGRIVWSRGFDLSTGMVIPAPAGFGPFWAGDALLPHGDARRGAGGFLSLPGDGLMLVASRPITSSDFKAPVAGSLVMGLAVDEYEIARLSEQAGLAMAVVPFGPGGAGQAPAEASSLVADPDRFLVKAIDRKNVAGYRLVRDLYGQPAALLRVILPREIHVVGSANLANSLLALGVAGLVASLLVALMVDRLVLKRLSRLSADMGRIGSTRDFGARVEVEGDDELSILESATNLALSELEAGARSLEASLAEKDLLVREIHHRVKNNLQVVSSLLNLQAAGLSDDNALAAIRGSQGRIRSMALIHELLYRDEAKTDLTSVGFLDYLGHLAGYLADLYHAGPDKVRISVSGDEVRLDADLATDCGLIASELISNALRHAFPGEARGRLDISLRRDGRAAILEVADDGVGLSAGAMAHIAADEGREGSARSGTTGLRLVHLIAEQMGSRLEFSPTRGGGCTAHLAFKPVAARS